MNKFKENLSKKEPSAAETRYKKYEGGENPDKEVFEYFNKELLKQNLEGKKILDLGCGDGQRLLFPLCEKTKVKQVVGVEKDDYTIEKLKEIRGEKEKEKGSSFEQLSIIQKDYSENELPHLPFKDKQFDIIVTSYLKNNMI